jgi:hypothetical protein
MEWYHVNNTGKGINLGDGEEVHSLTRIPLRMEASRHGQCSNGL